MPPAWLRKRVSEWTRDAFLDGKSTFYADIVTWRETGKYDWIDQALRLVDVTLFSPFALVGMLSVTASCARYLKARQEFFVMVEEHLKAKRKARLLVGLECPEDREEQERS